MALPQFDHKDLHTPQQRLLELEGELPAAVSEVEDAAAAVPKATRADRTAASAARVDEFDTPPSKAGPAKERHKAAQEHVTELRDDIETAKVRVQQALEANRADIRKDLGGAIAKDRADLAVVLDQVDAAVARLTRHVVDDAAAAGKKYLPDRALLVPGLPLPNGNDRKADEAITALRALTHAPEPSVVRTPPPPLSTNVIGRALHVRDGAA